MKQTVKIGTRDSELALWQAKKVQSLLTAQQVPTELVPIKSEGDINLAVPLYEMGVQGIFTRALDIALLEKKIDLAVHSYKDVPTQLPKGLINAAILKRDSYKDILVFKPETQDSSRESIGYINKQWTLDETIRNSAFTVATSSIRRKAQWLHRFPNHTVDNLRGNVNKRLAKLAASNWNGAIFAAAGLERINVRPENSIDLDWMLPAPAQGTVAVVAREDDKDLLAECARFNDEHTDICTRVERDFLRALAGGCSTPISALALIKNDRLIFKASLLSVDGSVKIETEMESDWRATEHLGTEAAQDILSKGGVPVVEAIRNAAK